MTRLDVVQRYAPKALWVAVAVVLPFSITTSYRVGAEVAQHESLDTLILRRLNALDVKLDHTSAKTDSVKVTVDSLRWLMLDRERFRIPSNPLRP